MNDYKLQTIASDVALPDPAHAEYRQQAREAIESGGWAKAIRDCLPVAEYFVGKDGEVINPNNLGRLMPAPFDRVGVLFTADQLRDYGDRRAAAEREKFAKFCEPLDCAHKCGIGHEVAKAIREGQS